MSAPPILVVSASPADGKRIAQGDRAGDPPFLFLTWEGFDAGLPPHPSFTALVCERTAELEARTGTMGMFRRAYPNTVLISFGGKGGRNDPTGGAATPFDTHLTAPMSAGNLRAVISRECRHLSVSRRYRQAVEKIRDQAEKLDLLIETAKAANSLLEPDLVMQLLMGRILELVHAESWVLYLQKEEGSDPAFEILQGDRSGGSRSSTLTGETALEARSFLGRSPLLLSDAQSLARRASATGMESIEGRRSIISVPLVSRGKVIGSAELFSGEGPAEDLFGDRELEIVRLLMEPAAVTIENAILFKKLEEQSVTDDLTRLYNSRYMNLCLERELKRANRYNQSLGLIFMDLDGFKSVNDAHGHLSGSQTLAEVGRLLMQSVRDTDIVARYGGDEFTIVMPHTLRPASLQIAERLRRAIEEHSFLTDSGLDVRLTASFGLASFPENGNTREELISQADRAMYGVKERGKNGVEAAPARVAVDCG